MAFVIYVICLYGMGSVHSRGITTSNKPWLLVYLYMLWMPDCLNIFFFPKRASVQMYA